MPYVGPEPWLSTMRHAAKEVIVDLDGKLVAGHHARPDVFRMEAPAVTDRSA